MERINLSSIKKESVNSIFQVIAQRENVSRADIARATSLSLMTVGKVVDALLERGVIVQVKENKNAAGRKAGLVHLNSDRFCIVLDLTTRKFTLTVIDITLHVQDKMEYEYNADFYYEENIYLFLKNVKIFALRRLDMNLCIGIGVSVPGRYNADLDVVENSRIPELSSVHLRGVFQDILSENVSMIDMDVALAAVSNMYTVENYMQKNIAYISLDQSISSAVLYRGNILFERFGGDIGNMMVRNNRTLMDALTDDGITPDSVPDLVMALYNMILCVKPDTVIIENALPCTVEHLEDTLHKRLDELLKECCDAPAVFLSQTDIPHAHRGLALCMRRQWLEETAKI